MALDTAGEVRVNRAKRLFDFLNSRGARKACPLCGQENWNGWDERVGSPMLPVPRPSNVRPK
jgi:hypothetical protein